MRRTGSFIIAAAVSALVAGFGAGHASGTSAPMCHGKRATIVGRGVVNGTPRADVIVLTGPSVVHAGAGNDLVCGSSGNDVIHAGAGDDVVYAGAGDDIVFGEAGNDRLYGEAGNDKLYGGSGHNLLVGGPGDNLIDGKPDHPRPTPTPTPSMTATPTPTPTPTSTTLAGTITISGYAFSQVTVPAGATVAVRNDDAVAHTLTIRSANIDVRVAAGATVTFVAPTTPGTYALTCDLHASMHGTLVVA